MGRTSWQVTIVEEDTGATLLSAVPAVLNQQVSRNEANAQFNELVFVEVSGSLTFGPITVVAGNTYTLTITHETFADTRLTIPEPTTVALFGAGLLGMAFFGFVHRRRSLPMA